MTVKDGGPLKGNAGALRVKKPKRKARKKTEMWRLNNQEAQKRFRKKQKVRWPAPVLAQASLRLCFRMAVMPTQSRRQPRTSSGMSP